MKVLNYLMKIDFMQSGDQGGRISEGVHPVFVAVHRLRQREDGLRLPARGTKNITR
jgi:hypothetical protein